MLTDLYKVSSSYAHWILRYRLATTMLLLHTHNSQLYRIQARLPPASNYNTTNEKKWDRWNPEYLRIPVTPLLYVKTTKRDRIHHYEMWLTKTMNCLFAGQCFRRQRHSSTTVYSSPQSKVFSGCIGCLAKDGGINSTTFSLSWNTRQATDMARYPVLYIMESIYTYM